MRAVLLLWVAVSSPVMGQTVDFKCVTTVPDGQATSNYFRISTDGSRWLAYAQDGGWDQLCPASSFLSEYDAIRCRGSSTEFTLTITDDGGVSVVMINRGDGTWTEYFQAHGQKPGDAVFGKCFRESPPARSK